MSSTFRRTQGDPAKARYYLPRSAFRDDEVAKLAAISRQPRFSPQASFRRYLPNSKSEKLSEYLQGHLGLALFSKVMAYCRSSIEPRMRSVSPP